MGNEQYQYYAIVTEDWPLVEDPDVVARRWTDENGQVHEEGFGQGLVWSTTQVIERVQSGKRSGEAHPISEEDGRRFEEVQAARVAVYAPADGKYSYLALVTKNYPLDEPAKVIRTWISPQGYDLEETYTYARGWIVSDVRYRVSRDSEHGDLVPVTEDVVERVKIQTAERGKRNQAQ